MSNKILFFGNERLATGVHTGVSTLQALIAGGYEVAAVVVAQNRPAKSRQARPLEVAAIAQQHHIPLLAPSNLAGARDQLAAFGAEAAVLIAYGKIVPQAVLDIFPKGIVNIHPSLLPLHRGSTPIESVILSGAAQTGVSLIRLSAKMDAGPIYTQQVAELAGTETKQTLAHRLSTIGVDLLIAHLPAILDGSLKPKPQDDDGATYDERISKAVSRLDWAKPALRLEREVRAYLEWPKSRTKLGLTDVIITKAHAVPVNNPDAKPGDIEVLPEGVIMIQCRTGYLCIDKLKPAGKPEMTAAAFLAGYKLSSGLTAG